ncbi:MAG: hypothetical protein OSP8Acid_13970 [uncultured Acidilobus sp. OSP8]|nr:MAG: hypothetical protein OSP8Acid_13970 [uncultured Acidilobus sp. OSP8]
MAIRTRARALLVLKRHHQGCLMVMRL